MTVNSNKKAFKNTVIIVLIIVFISAAVYFAYNFYNSSAAKNEYNNISTLPASSSEAEMLAYSLLLLCMGRNRNLLRRLLIRTG